MMESQARDFSRRLKKEIAGDVNTVSRCPEWVGKSEKVHYIQGTNRGFRWHFPPEVDTSISESVERQSLYDD